MVKAGIKIQQHVCFADQVNWLKTETGINLPILSAGRKHFFKTFSSWVNDGSVIKAKNFARILPDPVQGFSFSTPYDVLISAQAPGSRKDSKEACIDALTEFGLSQRHLTQPVNTLSGGEILLLNFAKIWLQAGKIDRLYACSPVYWLNESNFHYWEKLEDFLLKKGKKIFISILNGEVLPGIIQKYKISECSLKAVNWQLKSKGFKVTFPEISFPDYHPASEIKYSIASKDGIKLESPTLLIGNNGAGKSVFSKAIAGVLPIKGKIDVISKHEGRTRLLFQDSIDQLFGKSGHEHLDWVYSFNNDLKKQAQSLYEKLKAKVNADLSEASNSFLLGKIALIAERLIRKPKLMILDEPGWGISQEAGKLLVKAVCEECCEQCIPIILISHRHEWWENIVRSRLNLKVSEEGLVKIEKLI